MIDTKPERNHLPRQPQSRTELRVRLRGSNRRIAELITTQWLTQLFQTTQPATDAEPSLVHATSRSRSGPTAPPDAPYFPEQATDPMGASTMKPTPVQGALS